MTIAGFRELYIVRFRLDFFKPSIAERKEQDINTELEKDAERKEQDINTELEKNTRANETCLVEEQASESCLPTGRASFVQVQI